MTDQWTPSTEQVRESWSRGQTLEHDWTIDAARAHFDRWLAEVSATALEEAADGAVSLEALKVGVRAWLCARAARIREEGRA